MHTKEDALNKAKESWKRIIEWWKEFWKWTAKVIAGTGTALFNILKSGYHLIDALDKANWEKILAKIKEKKWANNTRDSILTNFLSNNILKILAVELILLYWWLETMQYHRDKDSDKVEVLQLKENEEKVSLTEEFLSSIDVLESLDWWGKKWQTKREENYLWQNEEWNTMRNGFWYAETKKVIEWMCRMIESWDLWMILKKAEEAWVPTQCVFLALAESWWQAGANSWKAWWYRQFTEQSAKDFGAIDEKWNDHRGDPEISTDAAMRHLKANYDIVCNYARRYKYDMSESDKWIFAFYMYNWSPNLVKKWMIACKWNANEYPEKQKNRENRNYVPRILWMEKAIQKIFKDNWYDINKIKSIYLGIKPEKTGADIMFDEFCNNKNNFSKEETIEKLKAIKSKYKEEYTSQLISKQYYEWAISRING